MSAQRDEQSRSNGPGWRVRYVSPADSQAMDALLSGEQAPPAADANEAARREQLSKLLGLLEVVGPSESAAEHEQGIRAAVARVEAVRQRERFATQVQMLTEPEPSIGIGWRQALSAAAVFLIAVSLLFPALKHNRSEARRIACATNLQQAAFGFSQYAAANQDMLPRGNVQPGAVWWNVGQRPAEENGVSPSNTAHLFILIRQRYVDPQTLACPEHRGAFMRQLSINQQDWPSPDAVSYSYQNQYTAEPQRLSQAPHRALLADKNPLFVFRMGSMSFDHETSRLSPSRIHEGRGQNVLAADGSVRWTIRPVMPVPRRGETNFWVADGVEVFTGRELPTSTDDSFLVP